MLDTQNFPIRNVASATPPKGGVGTALPGMWTTARMVVFLVREKTKGCTRETRTWELFHCETIVPNCILKEIFLRLGGYPLETILLR